MIIFKQLRIPTGIYLIRRSQNYKSVTTYHRTKLKTMALSELFKVCCTLEAEGTMHLKLNVQKPTCYIQHLCEKSSLSHISSRSLIHLFVPVNQFIIMTLVQILIYYHHLQKPQPHQTVQLSLAIVQQRFVLQILTKVEPFI